MAAKNIDGSCSALDCPSAMDICLELPAEPRPEVSTAWHFKLRVIARNLPANVVLTFATTLLMMCAAAAISVGTARLFGPTGRGTIVAAMAWANLVMAIGDLGLSQAFIFYAGKHHQEPGRILGLAVATGLVIGACLTAIVVVLAPIVFSRQAPQLVVPVRLYALSIPLSITTVYVYNVFLGLNRLRVFNFLRVAQPLLSLFALAAVVSKSWRGVNGFLGAIVFLQFMLLVLALVLAQRCARRWSLHLGLWTHLIRYGLKSYVGGLSWLANSRLDQLVLTLCLPLASVGIYATAVSYSMVVFGVGGAFAMVVQARVTASQTKALEAREGLVLMRSAILAMAACSVILALIAPWLIPRAFGAAFRASIIPAVVLLIAVVPLGCNYVLAVILRSIGHPLDNSKAELIGAAVTVASLAILVPRYGVLGAAFASLIAYSAITPFLRYWLYRRLRTGDIL